MVTRIDAEYTTPDGRQVASFDQCRCAPSFGRVEEMHPASRQTPSPARVVLVPPFLKVAAGGCREKYARKVPDMVSVPRRQSRFKSDENVGGNHIEPERRGCLATWTAGCIRQQKNRAVQHVHGRSIAGRLLPDHHLAIQLPSFRHGSVKVVPSMPDA